MPIDLLAQQSSANQPKDLLAGMQQPEQSTFGPQNVPGNLKSIGQYALGAYSGAMDPVFGTAALVNKGLNQIPGVNLPVPQKRELSQSQDYQAGRPIGQILANMGMTAIPGAGPASALGRIGAETLYGQAMDNNNGALKGMAGQTLAEALPYAKYAKPAIDAFRPQQAASAIVQTIGHGLNPEQTAQSLAGKVKKAYQGRQAEAASLYNPVFEKYGQTPVKANNINGMGSIPSKTREFLSNDPAMEDFYNSFDANPTFQNAHELRRELGIEARSLEKAKLKNGFLPGEDRRALKSYNEAKEALTNDMNRSISYDPELEKQYSLANKFFKENVAPYRSDPYITALATGKIENPQNIASIFASPEKSTLKIADDLGEHGKNQIVYSHLAQKGDFSPEGISKGVEDLNKKGLGQYVTPTLDDMVKKMKTKVTIRNAAQFLPGAIGGPIATHVAASHFGVSGVPELVATLGAAYPGGKGSMTGLQKFAPYLSAMKSPQSLKDIIKASYKVGVPAALSQIIARNQ